MELTSEMLLGQCVELLQHIYIAQLWSIGVVSAVFVCVLLYRFMRLFY